MSEHYPPAESALLAMLAAAFDRRDPVPPEVIAAAYRAGTTRAEAEGCRLWELLWDTAIPSPAVALRGPGDARVLSFGDQATTLRIQLEPTTTSVLRLIGLVSATSNNRPTAVAAHWPDGELHIAVDELGWFAADGVPTGPLHLTLHEAGQRVAMTPWFVG